MTDWSKLTVVKLKDELKGRGLSTAGLKAQLVSRLEEDDAAPAVTAQEEDSVAEATTETAAADPSPLPDEASKEPGNDDDGDKDVDGDKAVEAAEALKADDAGSPMEVTEDKVAHDESVKAPESPKSESKASSEKVAVGGDIVAQGLETKDSKAPHDEPVSVAKVEESSMGKPSRSPPKPDEPIPGVATQAEDTGYPPSQTQVDPVPRGMERSQSFLPESQVTVDLQEVLEDSRKRKRRSVSPPPLTQDLAMKKIRGEDGSPHVKIPDGMVGVQPTAADPSRPATDNEADRKPALADARFKGLFASNQGPSKETATNKSGPSRDVAVAKHPVTAALYIRNLMRPLQPASLRDHLKTLAKPETSEGEEDAIKEFYLDSIKSHCLVQFTTTAAASRVRASLHNKVWPDEKTRKPLWVDYVPEDKLKKWIEVELDSAGSRPPKRWEVVYEDETDGVAAYLQEGDSAGTRKDSTARNAPPIARAPDPMPPSPTGDPGQGFQALDDLFRSTSAKPKLYFLPVPTRAAETRLARLAAGRGGGRSNEMRRFTFEGQDLVDDGPEFRPGYRGGGGGGGGRGRGGFPGRGGGPRGGDSWRGGRER